GTIRYRFGGTGVSFLPDGKTVVAAQAQAVQFWEARTGRLLREIDLGPLSANLLALSRDGKRLAVAGSLTDETQPGWRVVARVLDSASGKEVRTFDRDLRDGVHDLVLSADGKLLMSLGRNGALRIEEVETGAELLRQQVPGDVLAYLALSADNSTLAVASGPNTRKLFVWKWQTGAEPTGLKVPDRVGRGLAFSPDGKRLAECTDDGPTVRLWDVESGRLLHKLEPPDREIHGHYHAAFSPDGKTLAAAGSGNRHSAVHLWDPATGKLVKRLDLGAGRL